MIQHDNILIVQVRPDDEIESVQLYRVNNESIMVKVEYKEYKLTVKTSWRVDIYVGDLSLYKWPIIVGRAKELTEEQWKELVSIRHIINGKLNRYENYTHPLNWYETATESGMSLLRSHGIDPESNPLILKKEVV